MDQVKINFTELEDSLILHGVESGRSDRAIADDLFMPKSYVQMRYAELTAIVYAPKSVELRIMTDAENEKIKQCAAKGMSDYLTAKLMERDTHEVKRAAKDLGVHFFKKKAYPLWSKADIDQLVSLKNAKMDDLSISEILGRTPSAVSNKLGKLRHAGVDI